MTHLGEVIIVALADQGYGVTITEEEVTVLTPDGWRLHRFPAAIFTRNAREYVNTLRVVVVGLQLIEGFTPPEGWRDL